MVNNRRVPGKVSGISPEVTHYKTVSQQLALMRVYKGIIIFGHLQQQFNDL